MKIIKIIIFVLLFPCLIFGQKGLSKDISAIVFLDSFVVTASKRGFDIADFIDIVQKDKSFLQAFHNLRFLEYTSTNDIQLFNREGKEKAHYYNKVQQHISNNCRAMNFLEEEVSGNFFKKKKQRTHRYYTARMHDQVFLTHGRVCETPSKPSISNENLSGIEKHINELKKLIFQPGRKVDVPFIGKKTAIFDENMLKYYDFYISSKNYRDKWDCYVFKAVAKPIYSSSKTIIKYMETFFDKKNFQVVGRNYHLKYDSVVDFDVKMKVELSKAGEKYIPIFIEYNGQWKIPMKKREIAAFAINFEF